MHGMADKDKSRGVGKPIIEVGDCEHSECCGTGECKSKKGDSVGELTISIQADVKDALTGFKALQRELRETTKATRELERAYERLNALPMRVGEDGRLEPIISAEISTTSTNKTTGLG